MNEPLRHALLPAGLPDVLPPEAVHEAVLVGRLMKVFASHGYQRVKPPLVEFEDSLLSGIGAGLAKQAFRVMDPASQRMMAIRPDMTPQVARIATTRLAHVARPLRLSYAGQVLRVKGSQLRAERQFGQAGCELIGSLAPEADAEVILLAARALAEVGVQNLSVDLCVPTLVPTLCRSWGLSEKDTLRLREALDRKDAAEVAAVGGEAARVSGELMRLSGQYEKEPGRVFGGLGRLNLPDAVQPDIRALQELLWLLMARWSPKWGITLDLVEYRGFEYQSGVSFTLFSRDVRGELGSGGRYHAGQALHPDGSVGEPATGFTLYTDTVIRAVPAPELPKRVFVPHGAERMFGERLRCLRAEGWVTVAGLAPVADAEEEARRLACDHGIVDGELRPVGRS